MATGVGMGFDFSGLNDACKKLDKKIGDIIRKGNAMEESLTKNFQNIANNGIEPLVKKLQQINTSLGGTSKVVDMINRIVMAFGKLKGETKVGVSTKDSDAAIKKLQKEIEQLKTQQEKTSQQVDKWKSKYDNLAQSVKRGGDNAKNFQQTQSKMLDTAGQLKRALAAAFSVSAIRGYVNKLVAIRGEFEMQQRSLQVLLQNKDEANALWDKTVELAVKSPFTTKQLVTYTKQLAAYRIESEKLYETNKMLADVSAGLGVDMNRLILAFGQVKAANFLRGTELRQFSEAGVNMLDELAKRFTALEGRAVSVGEVFERVSKRMVSFKDVEAVFKTITSEGGVFYQMQEKQSETLKGMMLNLRDSYDLMLNDIGKDKEGVIKSVVKTIKDIVDNWQEMAFTLEKVGFAYAAYLAVNKLAQVGTSKMGRSLINFAKSGNIAARSMVFLRSVLQGLATVGVIGVITAIVYGLTEFWRVATKASREAERLRKEIDGILAEDTSNLDSAIDKYVDLYTRLNDVNKGSLAHQEIINKINTEYGEYLNYLVDENTTMQQLADSYDEVVKVMKEKQALASFEKGLNAITEAYTNAYKDAKDDFIRILGSKIEIPKEERGGGSRRMFYLPTEKEVQDIFRLVEQEIRDLGAEEMDDIEEQIKIIQQIITKYFGRDLVFDPVHDELKLIDILVEKKQREKELQEDINRQYEEVLSSAEAQNALEKKRSEFDKKRRDVAEAVTDEFEKQVELAKLRDEEALAVIQLKFDYGLISTSEKSRLESAIKNWATPLTKSINDAMREGLQGFSEKELSNVLIDKEFQNTKGITEYLKRLKDGWQQANDLLATEISLASEGRYVNEDYVKSLERKERLYREAAALVGLELTYIERLGEETRNAINALLPKEYHITLEQAYGGIDKIITDLNKKAAQQVSIIGQINERKNEGLPFDEAALKKAEDTYLWTKKTLDLIDAKAKTPISESKVTSINAKLEEKFQINTIDRAKDEVTLLSEANSEKQKAIDYQKQLLAMQERGTTVTKEELALADKAVKQTTLRWELLGGVDKEKGGGRSRSNSLYDERIKVIDDMNKKYQELNKTLDKSTSLQGAFNAYIDAFADAFAGISWIPTNVRQMSANDFVSEVLNFPNEDELVRFLDKLAKEPMKAFEKIKVELAKGKYVMDMQVRVEKENDKAFQDQIEQMFSGYELSLELEKLNIPRDVAERLFGVDTFDLSEIRKRLEKELYNLQTAGGGQDQINALQKYLDRVVDMEKKAQQEMLKNYSKYLVQAQSERVKILLEQQKMLEDIASLPIGDEDKALMREGVRKEIQEKLDKQAWKDFQDSGMYLRLFENLEGASMQSLDTMEAKLEELRDSLTELDPTELKEINNQLEKIQELKVEKNPFKDLKEDATTFFEYLKNKKDWEKSLADSVAEEEALKQTIDSEQLAIKEDEKQLAATQKLLGANDDMVSALDAALQVRKANLKILLDELEAQGKITKSERKRLEGGEDAKKSLEDRFKSSAKYATGIASSLGDMTESLESVFGMSDGLKDTLQVIQGVGMGLGDILNGAAGIMSGNPLEMIQGGMSAISGVAKIIGSFNEAYDKKKERQIQAEIKLVQRLQKVYDDLGETIENTYSMDTLNQATKMSKKNLDEQIAATERMIQAEYDKKDTDHERIEDWKEEIEDAKKALKELNEQSIEEKGGFGGEANRKSAAAAFVDAWLQAYKETGDGLSGLNEQFDEFYEDFAKKQLLLGGVDKYLENFFNKFDTDISKIASPADAEKVAKDIITTWDGTAQNLDSLLRTLAENLGLSETLGAGTLGGLQKGIQDITTEQADVLASYWSSVRLYTADTNAKVTELTTKLFSDDTTANPMLSQLLSIAEQTTAIRKLFDSVVVGGHKMGQSGIKVFID